MKISRFLLCAALILAGFEIASAQLLRFGLGGGITKESAFRSEIYNLGWNARIQAFLPSVSGIQLGVYAGVTGLPPNTQGFIDEETPELQQLENAEVSGANYIASLVPTLRITTDQGGFLSLFGEFGAGWYVEVKDIEVSGLLLGQEVVQTVSETNNRFGLSAGLGMQVSEFGGFSFELLPQYYILAAPNGPYHYYTVSLMATYGIL